MQKADLERGESGFELLEFLHHGFDGPFVGLCHAWIDDISLPPLLELSTDKVPNVGECFGGTDKSADLPFVRRHFVNDGDVEIAVKRQSERARNGRGGHDEQMWVSPFTDQFLPLADAELVLLVDDDKAKLIEVET